jgi:hypothetical protein
VVGLETNPWGVNGLSYQGLFPNSSHHWFTSQHYSPPLIHVKKVELEEQKKNLTKKKNPKKGTSIGHQQGYL